MRLARGLPRLDGFIEVGDQQRQASGVHSPMVPREVEYGRVRWLIYSPCRSAIADSHCSSARSIGPRG